MRKRITDYKDFEAWQVAMDLAVKVYQHTATFPPSELYGLSAQVRRCAVSVASNIAEGYARESFTDYMRFLRIARGSLAELETQLLLGERLGYGQLPPELSDTLRSAQRLLGGLLRSLKDARGAE